MVHYTYLGVSGHNFQKMYSFVENLFAFSNSVYPDEMQHYAAFHLGLHCLQTYSFWGFPKLRADKIKILSNEGDLTYMYIKTHCFANVPTFGVFKQSQYSLIDMLKMDEVHFYIFSQLSFRLKHLASPMTFVWENYHRIASIF